MDIQTKSNRLFSIIKSLAKSATIVVALLVAWLLVSATNARAADGTWNSDSAGNWSDAAKWTSGTVADGVDFTATLGNFITATRIITLDSARSVGNITASDTSNDYTISGANTLTLDRTSGTPAISVPNGRTLTISSVIAGIDGLSKTGSGTLLLDGNNSYSGGTILTGGAITVGHNNAFGTGTITISESVTIDTTYGSYPQIPNALQVNTGKTLTTVGSTQYFGMTFTGAVSGDGTIQTGSSGNDANTREKLGLYSAANTFTGTLVNKGGSALINVNSLGDGGKIQLYANSTTGGFDLNAGTASPLLFNTRQIELYGSSAINNNNATVSNIITINTALTYNGAGVRTLTLGGSNTGANTFGGNIANNGGSAVSLTKTGAGKWAISGNISTTGGLSIDGGTLTLSGTNTYSGQTSFNANGTMLVFAGTNAVSPNTTFVMNINASSSASTAKLLDDAGGVNDSIVSVPNTFTIQNNNAPGNAHTFIVGNNNTANGGTSSGTTTGSTIAFGILNWNTYAAGTTAYGPIQIQGTDGYRLQINSVVLHNAANLTSPTVGSTFFTPTTANATLGTVTVGTGNTGQGYQTLVLDGTSSDNRVTGAISDASDVGTSGRPLRVTKSNTSTWTLSGANTYSGVTAVSAGVLNLQHATAAGTTASGISVTAGAAVQLQGGIIIGAEALALNGTGISADGALRNISGNNTYGGLVTLGSVSRINSDSGTLTLDVAAGDAITGTFNLTFGGAGNIAVADPITTGTGTLSKDGAGTLTLTGANTYTGVTTVNAGTLLVNSPGSLASGSAVTVAGGAALGGTGTINGTVNAAAGATITPAGNDTAGTLTLANAGATALTLNGNSLKFDVLSNNGATRDQIPITGTLVLNGVNTLIINAPSGIAAGSYSLMTFTAKSGSGSVVFPNGATTMGNLSVAVNATDVTLTVTGGLNDSTWKGDVNGTWDNSTANWTRDATPAQSYVAGDAVIFDDSATTFTVAGDTTTFAPASVNVNNSTTAYTISAVIAGASTPLVKDGTQTLTLSGASTYGGGTTLSSGQLNVNNGGSSSANSAIGTGALTIYGVGAARIDNTSGGDVTLQPTIAQTWSGDFTYVGSANSLNLGTGGVTLVSNRTVTVSAQTLTVGGVIGGGFGLTKAGSGTLTLSGNNTFTGGVTLQVGTLNIGSVGVAATSGPMGNGGTFTINGGSIDAVGANRVVANVNPIVLGGGFTFVGSYNLTLPGTVSLGAANRTITVTANTLTLSGVISESSGNRRLTKAGEGTLTLSGNNTYSGGTTVNAGTLKLNHNNALGNTAGVLTIDGGILDLDNRNQTVGNLTGTGGTILNSRNASAVTLTIGQSNTGGGNYQGVIADGAGTVAITKSGSATITLSGNNTFTGGLSMGGGGNIILGGSGALNSTPGSENAVSFTQNSATTLTLNGNSVVISRLYNTGGGGALNLVQNNMAGTATLTVGNSLNLSGTFSGILQNGAAGTLALTTAGTGTLTLSGANTYGGATTVSAGTLKLGAANVIPDGASKGNVSVTGTLDLNTYSETINGLSGGGTVDTVAGGTPTLTVGNNNQTSSFSGVIQDTAGTLALTKTGSGVLTLSGANAYAGATTISGGTLALGASNVLPNGSAVSIGAATLDAGTYADTAGTLAITGAATINLGSDAALAFADSSAVNWGANTLQITGTFVSGQSLRFGTSGAGLTAGQIAKITVAGVTTLGVNASGYLVSLDEVGTVYKVR
jgi:autotransporter-associated beta strand protein